MKTDELISIFKAGIDAVNPYRLVLQSLKVEGNILNIGNISYDLNQFNNILVIGAGKATASMAQAVEEVIGDKISNGLITVKYGHTRSLKKIKQLEAGHPLPDEAGVKGTEEIFKLLEGADEKSLVICLLSGGGSALLVSPLDGIILDEKKEVNRFLLSVGARIDEINTVRKHLSNVKGGRLSEISHPATLITLILSDVIGDRLDVIASGPTVPDNTTFKDAMNVIEKYNLLDKLPANVMILLKQGLRGDIKDTPKEGLIKDRTFIIGNLKHALTAAKEKVVSMGYETEIISSELQGEARDTAKYLSAKAIKVQQFLKSGESSRCLISGGETTVTVKGNGLGGRNQELALAFAVEIEGMKGITMLSAGTDGTDGPTDAAGAIVDGETVSKAKTLGLDPERYLNTNDSYNFFKRLDSLTGERHHVITGPTGTNVMDIQIILVGGNEK
ncbi:MAG TPA: glycerate kinase [Nitrospinota bacterium]|nr:glycerate kinase [Nitrospinota bacterium]